MSFDVINFACAKISQKSIQCAKKSSARAWGRWKLPSPPSPFLQDVLITDRFVARTRQPVRRRPECWQNDCSQALSLCQHRGHRLTACRACATNRDAAGSSCENGNSADGSFERSHARALHFSVHSSYLCENFSDANLSEWYWKWVDFFCTFKDQLQT